MSIISTLPVIIIDELATENYVPKLIKLKNLPLSSKYQSISSNSPKTNSSDSMNQMETSEFPAIAVPPLTPIKPVYSPKKLQANILFPKN
jgi:hypothetical protein